MPSSAARLRQPRKYVILFFNLFIFCVWFVCSLVLFGAGMPGSPLGGTGLPGGCCCHGYSPRKRNRRRGLCGHQFQGGVVSRCVWAEVPESGSVALGCPWGACPLGQAWAGDAG